PDGFHWDDRSISALSTTTAFNTRIDNRDDFLGMPSYVVCGVSGITQHCRIIPKSDPGAVRHWNELKEHAWIPPQAKGEEHEPRNGLLMCANHHIWFDNHTFFIRIQRFVFVNYSGNSSMQAFHGKAIALDINDKHAPFPSLFIIHEMRVRGHNPFQPVSPDTPDDITWQDWITTDGVLQEDGGPGLFRRDGPRHSPVINALPPTTMETSAGGTGISMALNQDVIMEILTASRASPSWKACVMEGTSWEGSAEENIDKYVKTVGVDPEEAHEDPDT
ncbi:hypothetical protein FOMPIDRAFT_1124464, partial [Fomitopsis schrenkii]